MSLRIAGMQLEALLSLPRGALQPSNFAMDFLITFPEQANPNGICEAHKVSA